MLSGYFVSFGQTSFGQTIGFLNHCRTENGETPVAYLSDIFSSSLTVISSSFPRFMKILLESIEEHLKHDTNKASIINALNETLSDIDFWLEKDDNLRSAYDFKLYKTDLTENWKLHNRF